MRTTIKIAFVLSVVLLASSSASHAEARKHKQVINGREVVVHSNPIPVVLHRMVPPQHGRHVTAREVQSGRVPQPGRGVFQRSR